MLASTRRPLLTLLLLAASNALGQPKDEAAAIEMLVEAIVERAPKDLKINRSVVRLDQKRALARTQWLLANPIPSGPRTMLSISFTTTEPSAQAAANLAEKVLGPGWTITALDEPRGRFVASNPPRAIAEGDAWTLAYGFGDEAVAEPSFEDVALPEDESADDKSVLQPFAKYVEPPLPVDWNLVDIGVKCAPGSDACVWKLEPSPGDGIRLCQLDTGYTEHPEVTRTVQRELLPNSNFVEPNERPDDPRDPMTDAECCGLFPGHGTGASSVIISDEGLHRTCAPGGEKCLVLDGDGASGCPLEGECSYVSGIAPKVKFFPMRVGRSVAYATGIPNLILKSDPRNIARALFRAINARCDVVSMALGTLQPLFDIRSAVHASASHGMILVAAAGQYVPAGPSWPARFAGNPKLADEAEPIVAVGGAEPIVVNGKRTYAPWKKTMSGPEISLSAPAVQIRAANTDYLRAQKKFDFNLETGDGTTFATGQVAGVAAIWLQRQRKAAGNADVAETIAKRFPPLVAKYGVKNAYIPCAYRAALRASANRPAKWSDDFGSGVLDAHRALGALDEPGLHGTLEKDIDNCLARFRLSDRSLRSGRNPGFDKLTAVEEKKTWVLKRPQVPLPVEFRKALGPATVPARYQAELEAIYSGHPALRLPGADVKAALRALGSKELRKALRLTP